MENLVNDVERIPGVVTQDRRKESYSSTWGDKRRGTGTPDYLETMVLSCACSGVGRVGRETRITDREEIFHSGKTPTLKNHSGHAVQRSASDKINEKLFISRCTWGKKHYLKKWVKGVWSRIKEEKNHFGCNLFSAPFLLTWSAAMSRGFWR